MSNQPIIEKEAINRADFMGRELTIKSEQFPGRILTTKVVGIYGDCLLIDRSGSGGLVNELINNQKISVQVTYRGEPVIFESKIVSPMKGRMYIPISQQLIPKIFRAFERYSLMLDVRLAYFNNTGISTTRLNRLKWLETKTKNISGGGIMVNLPVDLTKDFFMILHLGWDHPDVPKLLLGQVRHSHQAGNKFDVGIEFVIKETYRNNLPVSLIRNLPEKLFEFSDAGRKKMDNIIKDEKIGARNTGALV
ncbi:MAG: PilZ domain-containing protein [Candidatus Zixiibacteriota bacterium]